MPSVALFYSSPEWKRAVNLAAWGWLHELAALRPAGVGSVCAGWETQNFAEGGGECNRKQMEQRNVSDSQRL